MKVEDPILGNQVNMCTISDYILSQLYSSNIIDMKLQWLYLVFYKNITADIFTKAITMAIPAKFFL